MSAEPVHASGGWSCVRDALAEMRACLGGLQTITTEAFDQLDGVVEALLVRDMASQQAQQRTERESLQDRIDQLIQVASELTEALGVPKHDPAPKTDNG